MRVGECASDEEVHVGRASLAHEYELVVERQRRLAVEELCIGFVGVDVAGAVREVGCRDVVGQRHRIVALPDREQGVEVHVDHLLGRSGRTRPFRGVVLLGYQRPAFVVLEVEQVGVAVEKRRGCVEQHFGPQGECGSAGGAADPGRGVLGGQYSGRTLQISDDEVHAFVHGGSGNGQFVVIERYVLPLVRYDRNGSVLLEQRVVEIGPQETGFALHVFAFGLRHLAAFGHIVNEDRGRPDADVHLGVSVLPQLVGGGVLTVVVFLTGLLRVVPDHFVRSVEGSAAVERRGVGQ